MTNPKTAVKDFWNASACGEIYAQGDSEKEQFEAQERKRYELEPYLPEFANFKAAAGKDVLEIGVGMGADHLQLARSGPKSLTGIDLTDRAIELTSRRLGLYGFTSNLRVSDAENLAFASESFDLVYSWGVLHHTPDTPQAIREVYRVLRPGGVARIMIYHLHSFVGDMLWVRYGALRGKGLKAVYAEQLESPGTKAYTVAEARQMCAQFAEVSIRTHLSLGDLLQGEVGRRHQGPLLTFAKAMWPRRLIHHLFPEHGLFLLIEARK